MSVPMKPGVTVFERMEAHWPLLATAQFIETLKMAQFLYDEPGLALVVTKDDEVFALGSHQNQVFGLEHDPAKERPFEYQTLRWQKICKFASGNEHILALSETGVVYAWGNNSHGQLGTGDVSNTMIPIIVGSELTERKIVGIACGNEHSLALTDKGEVFSWGSNHSGCTGHGSAVEDTSLPRLIVGLKTETIVQIESCFETSVCLSRSGKVFTFGDHSSGQLGIGFTESNQAFFGESGMNPLDGYVPCLVKGLLPNHIEKIACGYEHVLAMSSVGMLYGWGENSKGQLGDGSEAAKFKPVQINFGKSGVDMRMVDISTDGKDASSAVSIDGSVFIWGSFADIFYIFPAKTVLKGNPINDTFTMNVLQTTDITQYKHAGGLIFDLAQAYNDINTSDFTIVVENYHIHVHKAILKIRSKYFRTMFDNNWRNLPNNKVVIENGHYNAYRAFLLYFYTGRLTDLCMKTAVKLIELARISEELDLVALCVDYVKKTLGFQNVAMVFSAALDLEHGDLADYCVRYAMRDMSYVVLSEAFTSMPDKHVKELMMKCVNKGIFSSC